jgi:hypothetical protein
MIVKIGVMRGSPRGRGIYLDNIFEALQLKEEDILQFILPPQKSTSNA